MSLLLLLQSASSAAGSVIVSGAPLPRSLGMTGRSLVITPRVGGLPPVVPPVPETFSGLAGADDTSAVIPVPSGVQAGDLIIIGLYTELFATVTPPAGFTLKTTITCSGSHLHQQQIWWKRATGADTGTYTFTFALAWREAWAARISGAVATGDPFDVFLNSATSDSVGSSTVTPAVATLTPTVNNCLVGFSGTNFNAGGWTPPSGFTERVDNGMAITLATVAQTTATATGSVTATAVNADVGRTGAVFVVLPVTGGVPLPTAPNVSDTVGWRGTGRSLVWTPEALQAQVADVAPVLPVVVAVPRLPALGRSVLADQVTDTPVVPGTTPTSSLVAADTTRTRFPAGVSTVIGIDADPPQVDAAPDSIVVAVPRVIPAGRSIIPNVDVESVTPIIPVVVTGSNRRPELGRSQVVAPTADPPVASPDTPVRPIVVSAPRIPGSGFVSQAGNDADTPIAIGDTPVRPTVANSPGPRPVGVSIVVAPRGDVAVAAPDTPGGPLVITGSPAPKPKAGSAFTASGFADTPGVSPINPVMMVPRVRPEPGRSLTYGGVFGNPPPPQITPVPPVIACMTHPAVPGRVFIAGMYTDTIGLIVASPTGFASAGNASSVTSQPGSGSSVTAVEGLKPTSVTGVSGSGTSVTAVSGNNGSSATAVGGG